MGNLSTMTFVMIMLFMFVITNHPLTMALALMLTSLTMGAVISLMSPTTWISYMLVMIFVSGMMIIILYMSSLSSNESITPSNFMKKMYFLGLLSGLIMVLPNQYFGVNLALLKNFFANPLFSTIYKTYTQLMSPMTIIIIFYLLIVLITAVNIIKVSKTPLRTYGE